MTQHNKPIYCESSSDWVLRLMLGLNDRPDWLTARQTTVLMGQEALEQSWGTASDYGFGDTEVFSVIAINTFSRRGWRAVYTE
jgi:hypothetical protein